MSDGTKVCSFCHREVGLPHHPGCVVRGQVQERHAAPLTSASSTTEDQT